MWLRLRSRLRLFLLSPPPEAASTRAGRLRQVLFGPTETEIAAILYPLCRRLGERDVLIGADGGI